MIRVAIVEDHPAISEGLTALIKGAPDVTVVGTARDVPSASTLIEHETPDVVLCDIRLADEGDGFELVDRYRTGPARSSCHCESRPSRASCAGCSIGTTSRAGRRSFVWRHGRAGTMRSGKPACR